MSAFVSLAILVLLSALPAMAPQYATFGCQKTAVGYIRIPAVNSSSKFLRLILE